MIVFYHPPAGWALLLIISPPFSLSEMGPLLDDTNFTFGPDQNYFLFFDIVIILPSIGAPWALSKQPKKAPCIYL